MARVSATSLGPVCRGWSARGDALDSNAPSGKRQPMAVFANAVRQPWLPYLWVGAVATARPRRRTCAVLTICSSTARAAVAAARLVPCDRRCRRWPACHAARRCEHAERGMLSGACRAGHAERGMPSRACRAGHADGLVVRLTEEHTHDFRYFWAIYPGAAALRKGFKAVPLMIGTNHDEGTTLSRSLSMWHSTTSFCFFARGLCGPWPL